MAGQLRDAPELVEHLPDADAGLGRLEGGGALALDLALELLLPPPLSGHVPHQAGSHGCFRGPDSCLRHLDVPGLTIPVTEANGVALLGSSPAAALLQEGQILLQHQILEGELPVQDLLPRPPGERLEGQVDLLDTAGVQMQDEGRVSGLLEEAAVEVVHGG